MFRGSQRKSVRRAFGPLPAACAPLSKALPSFDFVKPVKPLTSYTCKLGNEHAAALEGWLRARNYQFRTVPYAKFAAEKDKTNLVFSRERKTGGARKGDAGVR